mgnify:CR=1 FL=1
MLQKSIEKPTKNDIRFCIDFELQNGAKMTSKWEGKKWENLTLGLLGGQSGPQGPPKPPTGPPEPSKQSPRHPQSPKMDPKIAPERAKRYTSNPKQDEPRTKKTKKRTPTKQHTNTNPTNQQPNNPNDAARRNARSVWINSNRKQLSGNYPDSASKAQIDATVSHFIFAKPCFFKDVSANSSILHSKTLKFNECLS